jgi:hypothetical protein
MGTFYTVNRLHDTKHVRGGASRALQLLGLAVTHWACWQRRMHPLLPLFQSQIDCTLRRPFASARAPTAASSAGSCSSTLSGSA